MSRYLAALLIVLASWHAEAGSFSRDFAVVFIDSATEARYGRIPLDRGVLAQGIERAADAGAKGVVVKFFLDMPRSAAGDRRLSAAISRLPVLLQARMDSSEKNASPLPDRFTIAGLQAVAPEGESGWIPLPVFAEHANGVCFADFDSSTVPLVERYRNKAVKSLLLCAAEMAAGHAAEIVPGKSVSLGDASVALDGLNRVSIELREKGTPLATLAFHDLVEGKVLPGALKDKVVILAYDGPNIHVVPSPAGKVGAHRFFVLLLQDFYEELVP